MSNDPTLTGLNGLVRRMIKGGGPLTPDEWTELNPLLERWQIGVEIDPETCVWGKCKLGNGRTRWNDLDYFVDANGGTGEGGTVGPDLHYDLDLNGHTIIGQLEEPTLTIDGGLLG